MILQQNYCHLSPSIFIYLLLFTKQAELAKVELLTIIMIYYNDNLYARDEGLYLMSEVIGKGCIIVDGNVRDYID